jgi:hypothetical protein
MLARFRPGRGKRSRDGTSSGGSTGKVAPALEEGREETQVERWAEKSPRTFDTEIGVASLGGSRYKGGEDEEAVPRLRISDIIEEGKEMSEPPSSWHHVVRLRCLINDKSSCGSRLSWYLSAVLLVLVQWFVMLSFQSALSIRRCTAHDDCNHASYCAGLLTGDRAVDPLGPTSSYISRGVCNGCSTRVPDERHLSTLLENLCPLPRFGSERRKCL